MDKSEFEESLEVEEATYDIADITRESLHDIVRDEYGDSYNIGWNNAIKYIIIRFNL